MAEKKLDRRVKRTRALLNNALMQLIREKGYDNVTIEDITERANLGRTTFYLHYQSKDDLLLDHHDEFILRMDLGVLSREQLLGNEPQPGMVSFLQQISQAKLIYQAFTQTRDAEFIMRNVRERAVQNLTASLEQAFPDTASTLPLDVLTRYIVDAQFSLIDWWIRSRTPYEPLELATMMHQMRVALVREAFGLVGEEKV
ncbi:MAG: TetR/AcrR family transcriptional regulator [Chloroflexota bacterium]